MVEVIQIDRDAAARIVRWLNLSRVSGHQQHYAEMIEAGHQDGDEIVRECARHRLAERERCCRVAEMSCPGVISCADAIRTGDKP